LKTQKCTIGPPQKYTYEYSSTGGVLANIHFVKICVCTV